MLYPLGRIFHVQGGSAMRLLAVACFNGLGNGVVFVANGASKVLSPGLIGAGDSRAFALKLSEIVKRADQKRIASGIGDGAVK